MRAMIGMMVMAGALFAGEPLANMIEKAPQGTLRINLREDAPRDVVQLAKQIEAVYNTGDAARAAALAKGLDESWLLNSAGITYEPGQIITSRAKANAVQIDTVSPCDEVEIAYDPITDNLMAFAVWQEDSVTKYLNVYFSTDRGATWSLLSTWLPTEEIYVEAVNRDSSIYLANSFSTRSTWELDCFNPSTGSWVKTVFASTYPDNLWDFTLATSEDEGDPWQILLVAGADENGKVFYQYATGDVTDPGSWTDLDSLDVGASGWRDCLSADIYPSGIMFSYPRSSDNHIEVAEGDGSSWNYMDLGEPADVWDPHSSITSWGDTLAYVMWTDTMGNLRLSKLVDNGGTWTVYQATLGGGYHGEVLLDTATSNVVMGYGYDNLYFLSTDLNMNPRDNLVYPDQPAWAGTFAGVSLANMGAEMGLGFVLLSDQTPFFTKTSWMDPTGVAEANTKAGFRAAAEGGGIRFLLPEGRYEARAYDMTGREVYRGQVQNGSLWTPPSPGVYVIRVRGKGLVETKKVVWR